MFDTSCSLFPPSSPPPPPPQCLRHSLGLSSTFFLTPSKPVHCLKKIQNNIHIHIELKKQLLTVALPEINRKLGGGNGSDGFQDSRK